MEARRKTKIPLKPKLGYTSTKGILGICLCSTIRWMPGDRTSRSLDASLAIPTRVLRLKAFGALRPQTGQTGSPNWSGRFWPNSHARSSASALWLSWVTRWFSGEPSQTPRTWCSLRQSPHMTWLTRSPDSTLVLWPKQETVLDFILLSCHHAARTWPHWPPCPSNQTYLSSPHLEASPATTFRTCSSPALTRVKPQPAPVILSQESIHTTLSITHHTRKRPSTGPRTTHGPQFWLKDFELKFKFSLTSFCCSSKSRRAMGLNFGYVASYITCRVWEKICTKILCGSF
jgi:hypothetical protein